VEGEIGDTLIATLPPMTAARRSTRSQFPVRCADQHLLSPPPSRVDYGSEVLLDNVRYTPPDPEPSITFDSALPEHAKVLTHNYAMLLPLRGKPRTERFASGTVRLNGQLAPGKRFISG
jgi:hypothetical protein